MAFGLQEGHSLEKSLVSVKVPRFPLVTDYDVSTGGFPCTSSLHRR